MLKRDIKCSKTFINYHLWGNPDFKLFPLNVKPQMRCGGGALNGKCNIYTFVNRENI